MLASGATALGKHNLLSALIARRIAETLGNALAYPPNPYAPAGDPIEKTGHMRFAGTISVSHETLAAAMDAEWRPKGGRVFFIPVYEEGEDRMRAILTALDVPTNRTTPIDDASEMMALGSDNRWVRPDQLADDIAAVASADLGNQFIDGKVEVAVRRIRELVQ